MASPSQLRSTIDVGGRTMMRALDVMTRDVMTVISTTPVAEIAKLLIERGISAVPVVDHNRAVIGMVSEGDLLRRAEIGTERTRRRWLEVFTQTSRLADDYARAHGRIARDIMSEPVIQVDLETPLGEIVDLMERNRIKRVPVVESGKLVGIVTRGNLVRALAAVPPATPVEGLEDRRIKDMLQAELMRQPWGARHDDDIVVKDGVVHLWGTVGSDSESKALYVAARNVPGVKAVRDHTFVPPFIPYIGG
jgi:CBS domain-containing protein